MIYSSGQSFASSEEHLWSACKKECNSYSASIRFRKPVPPWPMLRGIF